MTKTGRPRVHKAVSWLAVSFGSRLRELRERAGMSQEELAGRAELTVRTVYRCEHGDKEPTLRTALLLAKGLGLRENELLSGMRERLGPFPGQGVEQ